MTSTLKATWNRLGLVFCPQGQFDWMHSHAANPFAEHLEADLFRVYFNCRDAQNKSSIASIVIDLNKPKSVLECASTPLLSPGKTGLFDDNGLSMGSIVKAEDGSRYLYYLGWNLGVTVPWRNTIGLAIQKNGVAGFEKYAEVPVMDRSQEDPLTLSYPWVMIENGKWRMWYGSHQSWATPEFEMIHVLKYAESDDGINWLRQDKPLLPLRFELGEFGMSRPCVVKHNGLYKMWFSFRGAEYAMGYAESVDGLSWERKDEEGVLLPSESGWDSQSVEYASVFEHKGSLFMFYNGNGYGKTGFGLARLNNR